MVESPVNQDEAVATGRDQSFTLFESDESTINLSINRYSDAESMSGGQKSERESENAGRSQQTTTHHTYSEDNGKQSKVQGETSSTDPPVPPDGGLKAWLQVVGCFFWWFNTWGLTNAFGAFQTYYESDLLRTQSPSQIAWIGTIQAFLLIGVGVLSGPAFDAGYFQELLWAGSFLVVLGHMMTSLCHEYWQVILAQGVTVGIGTGCLFTPSVVILPQYFTTKRALANGLAAAGASVGGTIYPIVFRELQPRIGFGWTVRVIAFIMLGTCGIAVALTMTANNKQPSKKRLLFDFKAFSHPPFAFFTLGLFFTLAGLYIPTFYISSFAIQVVHTDENLAFYMLPILNAGGVVGRILPSFFADKTGPLNVLAPTLAAAGILGFGWIGATNVPGLIVIAILYGYCSGTILALPPPTVATICPSLTVLGTWTGTSFSIAALGLFIGTPLVGAILNDTHQFLGLQIFCGAILLAASAFMLFARIHKAGWNVRVKA